MTFNTGKPVPSTDPRDLYDNAENLDKLVNGADPFYADRKGVLRESWAGMENSFSNAQEGRETAFTLSQADKEGRFQAFLVSSGYVSKGDYAANVVLAERNEYVAVDAATTGTTAGLYRPNAAATLPLALTGTWATDSANLVLLGDDVLRQELAGPYGAAMIGNGVVAVGTVDELFGIPAEQLRDDLSYSVSGVMFRYDGASLVNVSGFITAEAFGAAFDGVTSDTLPLQDAIEYADAENVPLITFKKQCFLSEAVAVKSITWHSYGTEFITQVIGKPALAVFNTAPKLLGVFRVTGVYDGTQAFPAAVSTTDHAVGSYAKSVLDFIYGDIPSSSSDSGILFRFTAKQSGIRVGEVHAKRHGTGVYWLSSSATAAEYTADTEIEAIYHEDVWCGIVLFGANGFRCKTVKGSYFRRAAPLGADPAHCVYLGDRKNPYRSENILFDHVENVVTATSPTDSVVTVKGANKVLIKTLIANDVAAGNTINGECRVNNLYSYATNKVVDFCWISDNNSEAGAWSREEAGTSVCEIDNAVIVNNTGRGSDVLGSQKIALFACYGGSRLRGTYSAVRVRNLDAVLSGVKPMHVSVQESDEISIAGRVRYESNLADPALYNYGDNSGSFNSWAMLYPCIFLWENDTATQKIHLLIEGYRWAIGSSHSNIDAAFSCVPKLRNPSEVVAVGDIRMYQGAYYSAGTAGVSSGVTWTPYPFSYSHAHSYRRSFKGVDYRPRRPVVEEPPVYAKFTSTVLETFGQPRLAVGTDGADKSIAQVKGLPVGHSVTLINVNGDSTISNGAYLRTSTLSHYLQWTEAKVTNFGDAFNRVGAY